MNFINKTACVLLCLFFLLSIAPQCGYGQNKKASGQKSLISCEERNVINIDKIADEIKYNNIGRLGFRHPVFKNLPFAIEVNNDKVRIKGIGSPNNWISFNEGGQSCTKWGLIGAYEICLGIQGDKIGIFDNSDWQYTSMFSDGEVRSDNLNLIIITSDNQGLISINKSDPVKIWQNVTAEEIKVESKSTCKSSCKIKNQEVCSKEGYNCKTIKKDFMDTDSGEVGSCYTMRSPISKSAYSICDKNGVITKKHTSSGETKEIGKGYFYSKIDMVCD
ncbi:MAG: hypothetical protein BWY08_00059 [Bacteroidetes bacterium ADurb.Bin174]|jgi:hypothetical protein|nr:MAG: hypothetical protein BWY08_00059 [Bacteroidetes bacterium ADurb.Bin174]